MKALDIILVLIFFAFAALQYNDPDALPWVVFYGVVGVIAVLALWGKYSLPFVLFVAVVCVVAMGMAMPGVIEYFTTTEPHRFMEQMSQDKMYIEETREFFGLLIALAALVFYTFRARNNKRSAASS